MSINDENYSTLICSLRFIVSSSKEGEQFKEKYPQYKVSSRRFFKDKTKYVITVVLEDGLDLRPLEKYLDSYNGRPSHDFFISVSTGRDSEIVEIPSFVVDYIRSIGGKVNFSFTCI